MPGITRRIVDGEAFALVPVQAFIYFMQDTAIEYQFDASVCDNDGRAFNVKDVPIPGPKIKLAVVGTSARRGTLGILRRWTVSAPRWGGACERERGGRRAIQHCPCPTDVHIRLSIEVFGCRDRGAGGL